MSDTTYNQSKLITKRPVEERLPLSRTGFLTLIWILAGLGLVRLLGIFTLPFTDTTEARYAEIARKMVETQDWITPQFAYDVPFWGKPPLHTWLSAAGMEIFGVNAFGARILIFACAIAVLALLYRWLRDEMGSGAALSAVVVLSSSVLFFGASAFVMTDLAMTLGIVLTMTSAWRVFTSDEDNLKHGLLVFVGLAIGLMAKGPVAAVLCGIPLVLWGLTSGRWRAFGKLPWLGGIALMLVLVAPWYIAAELKTPGFLNYFIIGEHFERFTVSDWQGDLYGNGHEQPKGAIWVGWALTFLPWSLAFIPFLFKPSKVKRAFASDTDGWRSYLLFWALSPMILFTVSANILVAYTLPGLPASAALLVCLYADLWGDRQPRAFRAIFMGFAIFIIAVGGFYAVTAGISPHNIKLRSERELVAKLNEVDSGAALYYLGKRSYSAEFYTSGQAQVLEDLSGLPQLPDTHALAIRQRDEAASAARLGDDYVRIGQYGRHVLFYHGAAAQEVEQ